MAAAEKARELNWGKVHSLLPSCPDTWKGRAAVPSSRYVFCRVRGFARAQILLGSFWPRRLCACTGSPFRWKLDFLLRSWKTGANAA